MKNRREFRSTGSNSVVWVEANSPSLAYHRLLKSQPEAAAAAQPPTPPADQPPAPPADHPPQGPFSLRDLSHETYQLSFVDMQSCIEILGYLGYNTAAPEGEVQLSQLPAVFPVPFKPSGSIVGKSTDQKATLAEETIAAPENRLMILYHSSQSADLAQLMDALQNTVDVPERQVLIEGMIIELSENDFKELGVEWKYWGSDYTVSFLPDGDFVPFMYYYNPEAAIPASLAHELSRKLTTLTRPCERSRRGNDHGCRRGYASIEVECGHNGHTHAF